MNDAELKITDILAMERSRMAAERTLMAWQRTSVSMISFGFAIYTFLKGVHEKSTVQPLRPDSPRNVALTLIGIGTFALVIACAQHWKYVSNLRPDQPYKPWDLTFIVACFIVLLGLLMLGSIMIESRVFG